MSSLGPKQFAQFFKAVYDFDPFPWQTRLAKRVCAGNWPQAIALPTAAGKTACIDIAIFALACGAKEAARRIFFVVDRRIVVDQAKLHTEILARKLKEAKSGILLEIANSLRELAQDDRPLDVFALRGGIYRETAWIRSPLQPTVIASTVDQVGSRLLFRGYGVSDSMNPIHAGMVGNDALILLDEAHCSRPFDQTMQAIKKYRLWKRAKTPPAPFNFVSITATPTAEIQEAEIQRQRQRSNEPALIEKTEAEDRSHPELGKRIQKSKPALLLVAEKAKGKKGTAELVKVLEKQARQLAEKFQCVGIIVNRVMTARALAAELEGEDVVLLTGRMRPLDRERLLEERLRPLLSDAKQGAPPKFVIGTQCLECGADFDFPALVTECASFDALRQRFGRLNRIANRETAEAVVIIRVDQCEDSAEDPIYGESLAETWKFLKRKSTDNTFDFGIAAVEAAIGGEDLTRLNAPSRNALVLLPAHLDMFVQTSPRPNLEPEPGWFLHGAEKPGQPDVQVIFRSDLGAGEDQWIEIVSLTPPSSAEAVAVPIGVFKKWLEATEAIDDPGGDVEGEQAEDDAADEFARSAVRWRGPTKSMLVRNSQDITPDSVYVIPADAAGASSLGDFPFGLTDCAEKAFQRSRDKALLRLLNSKLDQDEEDFEDRLTEEINARLQEDSAPWLVDAVGCLAKGGRARIVQPHPCGGWVITARRRLRKQEPGFVESTYLEEDDSSESPQQREIKLVEHSQGVSNYARKFAAGCRFQEEVAETFATAGLFHDLGKQDPRFQAMLRQTSPHIVVGEPLAKSDQIPLTGQERSEARRIHHYPAGARHELLSAALVASQTDDDLLLHLIATHHGMARPFADAVQENAFVTCPFKTQQLFGHSFELSTTKQRIADWNAELPERFWRVIRDHGWWGSAFFEALLRLADQAQSRAEQEKDYQNQPARLIEPRLPAQDKSGVRSKQMALPGLNGGNPLAFLTALGTLVLLDQSARSDSPVEWLHGGVKLSWLNQTPILHLIGDVPPEAGFAEFLGKLCVSTLDQHPARLTVSFFEPKDQDLDDKAKRLRGFINLATDADRGALEWIAGHVSDGAEGVSQLMTVRKDYFPDNLRSILGRCGPEHIRRALFAPWDYADGLDNQSLHWEPSEDRRHAYQWNMPSGDPTRKKQGGMLGANRLALEAWPLFPSLPSGDRLSTRGFKGNRANNTFWTWPLWRQPLSKEAVGSILGLDAFNEDEVDVGNVRALGIDKVFRLQRILVGKTPNLTTALAIA
jgi:CRISPR-associated endonuclease/helicase Cas3